MDVLEDARVLPKDQVARLEAIYEQVCGPSGRIDARGLKSVLDMIGANFSDSDVMDLVVEMDPRNKTLDFTDFLTIMTRPLDDDVVKDLEDAFDVLDRHNRGAVDSEDLRSVLSAVINTDISSLTVRGAHARFFSAEALRAARSFARVSAASRHDLSCAHCSCARGAYRHAR
jgi:Ca2+-binding EF-hand superfamily protein